MTDEIELNGLDGTNPLGFLAALGVFDAVHRAGRNPTLRWTDDLVPTPLISGAVDQVDLVAVLDEDRARWVGSIILHGPEGNRLDDVKPTPQVLEQWLQDLVDTLDDGRAECDLFSALLSEGGVDGNGKSKPTHLHFTAGQQKFLVMVRELADKVDADRLTEALFGPWREDSPLPSLSWSSHGERVYALRATNPSTDKRLGVPGADWLAFLGLVFFPTCVLDNRAGELSLATSGCNRRWKSSALRWPLWSVPLERDTAWSLVGAREVVGETLAQHADERAKAIESLRAMGVARVLQAPIRRTDQGGYGSFGGATVLIQAGDS
jgi:hypothetical protein